MMKRYLWAVLAAVGTSAAGIAVAVFSSATTLPWEEKKDERLLEKDHRYQDSIREAQQREEFPELRCIGSRWENSDAILSIVNRSTTRAANIIDVTFRVSDAPSLNLLRRVFPQPRNQGIGSANHVDDVFFKTGNWADNSYEFVANVGLHIEPGPANDLRLAILNPLLADHEFVGELDIHYDAGGEVATYLALRNVRVKAR